MIQKTGRISAEQIGETILTLVDERGDGKTICPSEVARALVGSDETVWRTLMQPIRRRAITLAKAGDIEITRKGKPVDPDDFKGVYRLRRKHGTKDPQQTAQTVT